MTFSKQGMGSSKMLVWSVESYNWPQTIILENGWKEAKKGSFEFISTRIVTKAHVKECTKLSYIITHYIQKELTKTSYKWSQDITLNFTYSALSKSSGIKKHKMIDTDTISYPLKVLVKYFYDINMLWENSRGSLVEEKLKKEGLNLGVPFRHLIRQ